MKAALLRTCPIKETSARNPRRVTRNARSRIAARTTYRWAVPPPSRTIKEDHVRHIKSEPSSRFLPALLAALLSLAVCSEACAQSSSRAFQMSLWSLPGDPPVTSADTDIQTFYQGQPQPPGRSVMLLFNYQSSTPLNNLGYDWGRIVAVQVDEPYMYSLNNQANPCGTSRMATVNSVDALMAAKAAELKSVSRKTRFWVNFTHYELDWMMDTSCPLQINKS